MINIKVKPEYEALLPPLPKNEYDALKESIKKNGLYHPITINHEGYILDGHNRFKICSELKVEPKHDLKVFNNPLLEKQFVIVSNLQRRHLTTFQKIEMAKPLIEIERELAQQRMKKGNPSEKFSEGKATTKVAKKIGVSDRTIEMALELDKKLPEKEKEKLRTGERAISNAYKELTFETKKNDLKKRIKELEPPEGKYSVIVVDPPWPYGTNYNPEGRRVASPYSEMSLDELAKLELPSADDCVLWLWTTNAFMHATFHLLDAWGFTHKTILTWVKNKFGVGYWLRGQTEHCIMAVKGKPIITLSNQTTVLHANTREHSRKPDEFYTLVETLCPGKKLDYFAGKKREGWDAYGTLEGART